MSTTSTPRTARFDLPPAPAYENSTATDSALADWTSKIKAMQRQVDADDEAEQRRLEEEVMRARLARRRRSRTGQSGDFGVGMHGIDLSKIQDGLSRSVEADLGTSASDKSLLSTVSLPKSATRPTSTASPMSLAAFMGGNASGPRLRRHEPQLDANAAYDGRVDHGPVHPVFGRGGIAMPGMVGHEAAAASPTPSASTSVTHVPSNPTVQAASSETSRTRTLSTSNVTRRFVEKIEEQASSQTPSQNSSGLGIRERRQSTPHGTFSAAPTPSFPSRPLSQNLGERVVTPAKSPIIESRPKTPSGTDIRPKTPIISDACPKTPAVDSRPKTPVIVEVRSKTPSTESHAKTLIDELRAKTPGGDTTRAKTPVQSSVSFPGTLPWQTPRHQPSPQLPSTSTFTPKSPGPSPARGTHAPQPQRGISPAFLRPPGGSLAKDPTPSISRLQGRGFVQSMVQASDRISGDPQGSPSTTPKHAFPSTSPVPSQVGNDVREKGARRASVLDRWTPVMSASSNGSPSPPLPTVKGVAPTRTHTVHASMRSVQGQDIPMVKTHDTGRSVRSAVSLPAIPKTPYKKPDGLPSQDSEEKIGSSSTMISYIKPVKTGDDPVIPDVDEMGVKASDGGVQAGAVGTGTGGSGVTHGAIPGTPGKAKTPRVSASPLPSSPGKPLSHPTKDRAKKPRKARFEEARLDGASAVAPSSSGSATGVQTAHQPPNLATLSSTGPPPNLPDTPDTPGSFDLGNGQPKAEAPIKMSSSSTAGRVSDRWTEPTLIAIKPTPSSPATNRATPGTKQVGRRALPGLPNTAVTGSDKDEKPAKEKEQRTTVPPSPPRHGRIPSTGNRALVMEVAQALSEAAQQDKVENETTAPVLPSAGPGGLVAERRKSSYERYAAVAMPPLAEERTPATTPATTVSRGVVQNVLGGKTASESPRGSLRAESAGTAELSSSVPSQSSSSSSSKVHIDLVDEPLPKVDVAALLNAEKPVGFVPNSDLRTISVEVMSIVHTSAVPVQRNTNVFYDAEVLVIVHRAKSRESGLVATKVWCWKGKKCHFEEREEKKVGKLAKRYGTTAEVVVQRHEPADLVHVLGGQLAIRQGTRAHWSSENTAMHVVRLNDGHILIDEMDLDVKNLCSGYSYCISILDNIYVWHGCGSVSVERSASLRYAHSMAAKGTLVKELVEGETDEDDEMFWMVVGDSDSYANADYWRWRSSMVPSEPRCWLVDVTNSGNPIRPVPTVFAENVQQESVYIIDCFWEFFVLVGKDARAKRPDISLAINSAMAMAPLVASSKPFSPTVHVLILPTQLPLDMRHAFRNLDELELNGGFVPDHMNILSTPEAIEHLRTSSWDRSVLRDHTMLPLGLDSAHVPLS